MSSIVSGLFGPSKAQKQAEAAAQAAEQSAADAQTRAARGSEEDAALAASNQSAAARIARAQGKRALAWNAFAPAVATTGTPGSAATLGG